jgi:hypothetical protein
MKVARAGALLSLAASLAGNVWLARRRHDRRPQGEERAGEAEVTRARANPGAPAAAVVAPAALPARDLDPCQQQVAALEREIAAEGEALRVALPPDRLFERGQPNPEARRLIEPVVSRLFAAKGRRQRGPTLHCQDLACKLVLTEPATTADEAWDQALTGDAELLSLTAGPAVAEATTREDPVTHERFVERTVYFKLNGPRAIATLTQDHPTPEGR